MKSSQFAELMKRSAIRWQRQGQTALASAIMSVVLRFGEGYTAGFLAEYCNRLAFSPPDTWQLFRRVMLAWGIAISRNWQGGGFTEARMSAMVAKAKSEAEQAGVTVIW